MVGHTGFSTTLNIRLDSNLTDATYCCKKVIKTVNNLDTQSICCSNGSRGECINLYSSNAFVPVTGTYHGVLYQIL